MDDQGIPISGGIPPIVKWTGVAGVLLALVVVACVIYASRYGHMWPAANTLHLKLG